MASHSSAVGEILNAAVTRHGASRLLSSPYFGGNSAWAKDIASCPALAEASRKARVFYLLSALKADQICRLLIDVPAIATSGDRHIVLQNGEHTAAVCTQLPGLLTWQERRRARKRALLSWEKAYGSGGFRCPLVEFKVPRWVCLISVAGPQFEMRYLESRDFIIAPDEHEEMARLQPSPPEPEPLFPQYYAKDSRLGEFSGRKPNWEFVSKASKELLAALDIIPVPDTQYHDDDGRATYLYGQAYENSLFEDMWLVLKSFDSWLEENAITTESSGAGEKVPGYLQLPMVGLGFFASYLMRYNLTPLLIPRFLRGLKRALEVGPDSSAPGSKPWKNLQVLELCDFTRDGTFVIKDAAFVTDAAGAGAGTALGSDFKPTAIINGVTILHGPKRGLLDLPESLWSTHTVGIVNAGDAFCLPGNEHGYCSVEAMLGENSSIRRGQSYLLNPLLLDESRHIALKSPLA